MTLLNITSALVISEPVLASSKVALKIEEVATLSDPVPLSSVVGTKVAAAPVISDIVAASAISQEIAKLDVLGLSANGPLA
jgi:hypothetical protein